MEHDKAELEELSKEIGFELPIDKEFSAFAGKPIIDLVTLAKKLEVPEDKSIKDTIIEKYGNDFLEKLKQYIFI